MIGFMLLLVVAATIHATQGVMLTSYIVEYSLEGSQQGYAGSIESIGLILSMVLSSILLSKFSKPKVLAILSVLQFFSLFVMGLKPPFFVICLAYLFFGLSFGSLDALSVSLLSDMHGEKASSYICYTKAAYSVGGMIVPLAMSGLMKSGMSWNWTILLFSFFSAMFTGFFLFVTYPRISRVSLNCSLVSKNRSDIISFPALRAFLKLDRAVPSILCGFFYSMHQLGFTVWIVRYVSKNMSNPGGSSYILTCYWMGMLLCRLLIAKAISSQKIVMVFGNLISFILISFGIISGNGTVLCILAAFAGISEGLVNPVLMNFSCNIDHSQSALASSVMIVASSIGGMIVPSLIGKIVASFSPIIGIMLTSVASLLCVFMALIMFRKKNIAEKGFN